MAETTLGMRILGAAMGLSLAGNSRTASKVMTDLRALAARADAAERLAKAAVALPVAREKWVAADDAGDIIEAFEAFTVVRKEHEQAAGVWRAITEGNEVTR